MTDVEVNNNNLIVIPMIIELCQKFDSIRQNLTKLNLIQIHLKISEEEKGEVLDITFAK